MVITAQLIQAGMALVPVPLKEKGPNLKNWNLPGNCVTDTRHAAQFSGINVGLAHAYCKPTPTCAIDVDHYKHGKAWLATHGIDLGNLLFSSDAVVILSGKKYSLKLLYRLPPGSSALESKKIVGPDGKSAIEFRCASKDGKTVQDLLPPSLHPAGRSYEWTGSGNPLEIPEIPADLICLWQMLISNGSRVSARRYPQSTKQSQRQESPRQVATMTDALCHISADCTYEHWRNIVWAILSTGWTCAEDVARNWSLSAPDRYNEDAFWLLANSYIPNHTNPISAGTIVHYARFGGWNG